MNCRHCKNILKKTFVDLGFAPPSNSYLNIEDLSKPEKYYPLKIMVCENCWLVQTEDYAKVDELFSSNYAYFSSTSTSWLKHAENYAKKMIASSNLDKDSFVIEVASNDGYLLKNFVALGIPCLGIEPTDSTAIVAEKEGIHVLRDFFTEKLGKELANKKKKADLIIGNNVFAHVPNINDFTMGLKAALKESGTITLEFPHLMRLIKDNQFDTIYHEHFSYLSLYTANRIFQNAGLRIWNVEELSTHGGSLRIFGCHQKDPRPTLSSVQNLLSRETKFGLQSHDAYSTFQVKVENIKNNLLNFLIEQKHLGKNVVAYGAAAKGNTLLNYAGIKSDLISCVYDAAIAKQEKFLPGSHIPILAPEQLEKSSPDFIIILPWNLRSEIETQLSKMHELGSKFVVALPEIESF